MKKKTITIIARLVLTLIMSLWVMPYTYVGGTTEVKGATTQESQVLKADSITDIMDDWDKQNVPDSNKMKEGQKISHGIFGVLTSIIIWIIFAALAFTTACDLLYISFPGIRSVLWEDQSTGGQQRQSAMPGMMGQTLSQNRPTNNATEGSKGRCLISQELKSIMRTQNSQQPTQGRTTNQANIPQGSGSILKEYFKARAINIIVIVVILLVLLTTSFFTDTGFNIGSKILELLGI